MMGLLKVLSLLNLIAVISGDGHQVLALEQTLLQSKAPAMGEDHQHTQPSRESSVILEQLKKGLESRGQELTVSDDEMQSLIDRVNRANGVAETNSTDGNIGKSIILTRLKEASVTSAAPSVEIETPKTTKVQITISTTTDAAFPSKWQEILMSIINSHQNSAGCYRCNIY